MKANQINKIRVISVIRGFYSPFALKNRFPVHKKAHIVKMFLQDIMSRPLDTSDQRLAIFSPNEPNRQNDIS